MYELSTLVRLRCYCMCAFPLVPCSDHSTRVPKEQLGGDGTVLYSSWLFQKIVPPVIPFALGSLGFLTSNDFNDYATILDNAITKGVRVNLRMRFTCTVYRSVVSPEGEAKKRRAIRSGKTGDIFMDNLSESGWEAIESGSGVGAARGHPDQPERDGNEKKSTRRSKRRDKEIKCFSTRPAESFEVLNVRAASLLRWRSYQWLTLAENLSTGTCGRSRTIALRFVT